MDIQPVGNGAIAAIGQALDAARAPASNPLVRSLQQGRQHAAAQGLSFARQSLETALTGANLIALVGGDGRAVLAQARDAVVTADQSVRSLRDGILDAVAQGDTPVAAARGQLRGLGLAVIGLRGLAEAIINSPSTARVGWFDPARKRPVATIRAALDDMARAVNLTI